MNFQYPRALHVGRDSISEYMDEPWEEIDHDPRGVLLMWEPPVPGKVYKLGVDATEGITGWTRGGRADGDEKTDNGVVEVFNPDGAFVKLFKKEGGAIVPDIDESTGKQKRLYKDVQVAEWAGPCDAVEIARIANVIGRIYAAPDEDQAELILESWPGVGMLTMQELIRLNYGNMWHWEYFADGPAEETNWIGWRSTDRSKRLLWNRARRHIMQGHVQFRSKFLVAEYSNAEMDLIKMRAKAAYGYHDDRFDATNMCLWASHGWTYDVDSTQLPVTQSPVKDYQTFAPTLDENISYEQWKEAALDEWGD